MLREAITLSSDVSVEGLLGIKSHQHHKTRVPDGSRPRVRTHESCVSAPDPGGLTFSAQAYAPRRNGFPDARSAQGTTDSREVEGPPPARGSRPHAPYRNCEHWV